ncbi:Mitochondrial transcription termination factor family protein [Prunus dulcis]|uniref:Mitochondrial transcription termination factor family protein n=1 Tax=Prunus dulcis TaxID=3755 RepID=A0A4Y1R3M3_PRUDU|nr:Mitochondrial transcription termination factor family protein [Prunus dulcis]
MWPNGQSWGSQISSTVKKVRNVAPSNKKIASSSVIRKCVLLHKEGTMGQGEEVKTRADAQVEIQERGEIFFFYRPKVNKEEAHSPDDVQRLYIVLRPESGERPIEEKQEPDSGKEGAKKKGSNSGEKGSGRSQSSEGGHGRQEVNIEKQPLLRFIVMGRKSLPDPSKKGRPYWGFVEMVTTNIDDVKTALQGEEYDTKTEGHRHTSAARALGEGIYRIVRHKEGKKKPHTHLIYKLEFPPEDENNEPQESLNIKHEGSFHIQIKNPDQHGSSSTSRFRGLQNNRRAMFPAHLQGQFGNLRYCPADPPDFLNYEGCEFLLISASDDIEEELGLELQTEGEAVESCSDLIKTFGETASTTEVPPKGDPTYLKIRPKNKLAQKKRLYLFLCMDVIPLTMSSSSKFLQIPTTLTLTFKLSSSPNKPTNPSLLPNPSNPTLTLRLHQTHKPKNPIFHTPSKTHHHLHHTLFSTPPNSPAPPPDHQSEQFKAAQDALLEFLQEFGVSETEATFVSSNSPRYLRMLVDGVLELDELGLWRERERKEGRELVGFKEKVRYLAKEKGDNGKVAFLESVVGLSLSSAMNLARHLSAETLPRLVEKVKYVKEIFFSGSNDVGLIGKNARRMMMHLSIPIDEDLQQTLSFFEKQGVEVGVEDKDVGRMLYSRELQGGSFFLRFGEGTESNQVPKMSVGLAIKSWPHVLGCSTSLLKLMVDQLGELGIRNKKLGQVVSFVEGLGFDKETVGIILGRCPEIFAASIERTLSKKLQFLASIGVSKVHLPRDEVFDEEGLSRRDIAFMVRRFSPLLGYSIEEVLRPKLEFLINTMEKPVTDLVEYPRYFSYSLEKKIKPRYWVLKARNVECSLKDMLGKNDEQFAEEFMGVGSMLVPLPPSPRQ